MKNVLPPVVDFFTEMSVKTVCLHFYEGFYFILVQYSRKNMRRSQTILKKRLRNSHFRVNLNGQDLLLVMSRI
jgi:hypothetical protein